jgi:hypothetical protein
VERAKVTSLYDRHLDELHDKAFAPKTHVRIDPVLNILPDLRQLPHQQFGGAVNNCFFPGSTAFRTVS